MPRNPEMEIDLTGILGLSFGFVLVSSGLKQELREVFAVEVPLLVEVP
jgi:hypothetical protein